MYSKIIVSRIFGASSMIFNIKTEHLSYDKANVSTIKRNFILASTWYLLSLLIIFKHSKNKENLDQFHLTFAWWLGYTLVLTVYSILRFYTPEFCDTANGATNILRQIHGNNKKLLYIHSFISK